MATPTYELIETTTLASSASSVTFSSITQAYRDLVLVVEASPATTPGYFRLQINGDTGSNYSGVVASGDQSGDVRSNSATYGHIQWDFSTEQSTTKTLSFFNFLDYSATDKHKPILSRHSQNPDVDNQVAMQAYRWANTSAITSLEFFYHSPNVASGSTFSLFGIAA